MRKIVVTLMCACVIFAFCGCQRKGETGETVFQKETAKETVAATTEMTTAYVEPDSVPDTVVLSNVSLSSETTYEISHSYDADAHIDEVTLTLYDKVAFGTETTTCTYTYQYDRSSDSWELLSENTGGNAFSTFDIEALLDKATFEGKTNEYHGCTYTISVLEIDIENLTIKIKYKLKFKSDSVQD